MEKTLNKNKLDVSRAICCLRMGAVLVGAGQATRQQNMNKRVMLIFYI